MAKKLYVGNLPYSVTEDSLKTAFEKCGTVDSAVVIMDRETGRSKGFGFVEMGTEEEASSAITEMNGVDMEGRALRVNEARPKASGGAGPRRYSGGYGGGFGR